LHQRSQKIPVLRQYLLQLLAPEEARRLLAAARSARDRLALGLLHGCGLKVGELCALRVGDADPDTRTLTVTFAGGTRRRSAQIPSDLLPLLRAEISFRKAGDFLFRGRAAGLPLSARTIQRVVRSAARLAGLPKEVTPMTLRHSHAVTRLREGENIRVLQEDLGHRLVETTLAYSRYILPPDLVSPADRLSISPRVQQPTRPASASPCLAGGP
jgi:integrase/recombinase XerD